MRNFSSCLQRQVNEAVRITSSKADFIKNSKSEFHQAPIVRVTVAAGLEREQGEEEGAGVRGSWRGPRGARGRGAGRGRAGRARARGAGRGGPGRARGRGAGRGRRGPGA